MFEVAEQTQERKLSEKESPMDWEGFFTHYRKPGFIPGYEIVNKLGSGVFGEVYKARKESIGKFYAIKFLKVSDEKISEAIFKELDTLRYFAQIDHPNLVSIEDQGEVMGIPYIVMGYGGDQTLKKRLSAGRMAAEQVDSIFRQTCEGVSALHEKSIIHFDLKPANIFMKGDHARVGDYGLSKLVSESHNTMSIGRGTPYYMAPEMLRRRGDHLSDIYSLGVILYEMLTGDVPFKGDSEWEVLRKHESEPVVMPPMIAAPYRSVIARAMQKTPSDRFASVREMIQALEGSSGRPSTGGFIVPPSTALTPAASGPPPLPTHCDRKPGEVAREVKERLGEIVGNLKEVGGIAAEQAREIYRNKVQAKAQVSPVPDSPGMGSFYSDFEGGEAGAGMPAGVVEVDEDDEFVEAIDLKLAPKPRLKPKKVSETEPKKSPKGDAVPKPKKPRSGVGWFFYLLFSPVRLVFKGLGIFFKNFFRYVFILALTFGLGILIHGLIRGWEFGF
ncbi:MAG: serine/threonine-protein kinase [Planctomycetota bacterium]